MSIGSLQIDWRQVVAGLVALGVGVLFYAVDRPADYTYFLPQALSLYNPTSSVFGAIGSHLPTFLHVFAFCLLTSGVLGCDKRCALLVCCFWLGIDGLFEIAQHAAIAKRLVPIIPQWFDGIPVLENTANYFARGRFDPLDLASIMLGAGIAYLLIIFLAAHDTRQQA